MYGKVASRALQAPAVASLQRMIDAIVSRWYWTELVGMEGRLGHLAARKADRDLESTEAPVLVFCTYIAHIMLCQSFALGAMSRKW